MKKRYLFIFLLLPLILGAESDINGINEALSLLPMSVMATIFYCLAVFSPLSKSLTSTKLSKTIVFLLLFIIRVIILTIGVIYDVKNIIILDFMGVFILPITLVPIVGIIGKYIKKFTHTHNKYERQLNMFCKKCGSKLDINNKTCTNCGAISHLYKES